MISRTKKFRKTQPKEGQAMVNIVKKKTSTKKTPSGSAKKKTITKKMAATKKVAKPKKAEKAVPPASTVQLKVGQKAPAFSLPNQDGRL